MVDWTNAVSTCLKILPFVHSLLPSEETTQTITRGVSSDLYESISIFVFFVHFHIVSERELMFTFAICYCPSVCLSSVCLSSVTLVRPTQAVEIFGNISTAFGTSAIRWYPGKILWRLSQRNPSVGGVKHNRGSQIWRFWTYRRLYLGNGAI